MTCECIFMSRNIDQEIGHYKSHCKAKTLLTRTSSRDLQVWQLPNEMSIKPGMNKRVARLHLGTTAVSSSTSQE